MSATTTTIMIRPLGGNVIVEREVRETTSGGIVIPEVARDGGPGWTEKDGMRVAAVASGYDERRVWARVIAVGPGRKLPNGRRADPTTVKPGDRVVLEKWDGIEFQLDGRNLLLVDESGVLAVAEE